MRIPFDQLDMAEDAFDAHPCADTAYDYWITALDYLDAGLIGETEYMAIYRETAPLIPVDW